MEKATSQALVCSYLALPMDGAADTLAARLAALPDCEVVRATNRDVLLVVTTAPSPEADAALRERMERLEGLRALILTFGEIRPPA